MVGLRHAICAVHREGRNGRFRIDVRTIPSGNHVTSTHIDASTGHIRILDLKFKQRHSVFETERSASFFSIGDGDGRLAVKTAGNQSLLSRNIHGGHSIGAFRHTKVHGSLGRCGRIDSQIVTICKVIARIGKGRRRSRIGGGKRKAGTGSRQGGSVPIGIDGNLVAALPDGLRLAGIILSQNSLGGRNAFPLRSEREPGSKDIVIRGFYILGAGCQHEDSHCTEETVLVFHLLSSYNSDKSTSSHTSVSAVGLPELAHTVRSIFTIRLRTSGCW